MTAIFSLFCVGTVMYSKWWHIFKINALDGLFYHFFLSNQGHDPVNERIQKNITIIDMNFLNEAS